MSRRRHGRLPEQAAPPTGAESRPEAKDPKIDRTIEMNDLLKLALQAHGGLDRWNKVQAIKIAASITGGIWYVKGKGDFLKNVVLTAETRNERLTVDFPGQNKRAIFEPNRVVIEKVDGTLIEARD